LTARATLTTALPALRTLRTEFFRRQLAVAILVERLQRRGRVRDLLLVDGAIVVRIERGHQRAAHHALAAAGTALAARATGSTATLTRRRVIAFTLCQRERGRNAERERGQQDCL